MLTFIPISNLFRYNATVLVDNNSLYFQFRWNTRTKSYFVLVTNSSTGEVLISNKTIYSDGYLELNRNSRDLVGFLQLVPLTERTTNNLKSWADTHVLALSTAAT